MTLLNPTVFLVTLVAAALGQLSPERQAAGRTPPISDRSGSLSNLRHDTGQSARQAQERFLVTDRGYSLLGFDGTERERLDSTMHGAGGISTDGQHIAYTRSAPKSPPNDARYQLVVRSLHRLHEATVPMVWGGTGSSFIPLWSADSQRVLICEQGVNADGSRGSAYRLYNLPAKRLTRLKIRDEYWPSDWSADGKRFLTNINTDKGGTRVAWVNIDGTGTPEFLTPEDEVAYGAKLSPDGRRILCLAGPSAPKGEPSFLKLVAVDLATMARKVIDKPGHTYGYCWSSDGQQVAYTWQMPLRTPEETPVRRTYLVTCDADGGNRKTVTMREYEVRPNSSGRNAVVYFFQVWSWWR